MRKIEELANLKLDEILENDFKPRGTCYNQHEYENLMCKRIAYLTQIFEAVDELTSDSSSQVAIELIKVNNNYLKALRDERFGTFFGANAEDDQKLGEYKSMFKLCYSFAVVAEFIVKSIRSEAYVFNPEQIKDAYDFLTKNINNLPGASGKHSLLKAFCAVAGAMLSAMLIIGLVVTQFWLKKDIPYSNDEDGRYSLMTYIGGYIAGGLGMVAGGIAGLCYGASSVPSGMSTSFVQLAKLASQQGIFGDINRTHQVGIDVDVDVDKISSQQSSKEDQPLLERKQDKSKCLVM